MKKPFLNPYADLNESSENVMTCFVDLSDKDLLRTIRTGAQGTFSTTLCLLVKQLCHELRELNITQPTDRTAYEDFITNIRIVDADEYEALRQQLSDFVQRDIANGLLDRPSGGTAAPRQSRSHDSGANPGEGVGMETGQVQRSDLAGKVKRGKVRKGSGGG